jgi:hypothetical protein
MVAPTIGHKSTVCGVIFAVLRGCACVTYDLLARPRPVSAAHLDIVIRVIAWGYQWCPGVTGCDPATMMDSFWRYPLP